MYSENMSNRREWRKSCEHMVSAIVIIAKRQPQFTYVVRAEGWLNPRLYIMDVQDPYTGETAIILKDHYKVGWVLDENGEPNYSF
jgi:hypothetical protein